MKKTAILLMFMLTLTGLGLVSVLGTHGQVDEAQNIQIGSHSWYIDTLGNLVVVGEVQNIGPDVIDQILLTGTAFTQDGLSSRSYTGVWAAQLLPQQKAPFDMDFQPPDGSNGWYSVGDISLTVALANSTSKYQYPDLKITSSSASIGTTGNYNGAYVVEGTIQNTGTQAATKLTVVGTFFNSTGAVVAVGYTDYLEPQTLNPSKSLDFLIAAFDLNQSEVPAGLKISSYSLLVQAEGPLLEGAAPIATPYTTSSGTQPDQNQTGSNSGNSSLVYIGVVAVVIIAIVAAFLLLKRRSKPVSANKPAPAKPAYQPKPSKRNRK